MKYPMNEIFNNQQNIEIFFTRQMLQQEQRCTICRRVHLPKHHDHDHDQHYRHHHHYMQKLIPIIIVSKRIQRRPHLSITHQPRKYEGT